MKRVVTVTLLALMVVVAGCGGASTTPNTAGAATDAATTAAGTDDASSTDATTASSSDAGSSDDGTSDSDSDAGSSDTDESDSTDGSSADTSSSDVEGGTVHFYVSDERNDIDDFEHLNVTISKVGIQGGESESGGWTEYEVADSESVDLTELKGDKASLLDSFEVENGTYHKVFVYVSEVEGTVDGEEVTVKLPSSKLQLNKPFAVGDGEEVSFVFDITVKEAGKSGKYVLQPVIGESGTDVPIDEVDGDDDEDDDDEHDSHLADLNASFVGEVAVGENATVEVTRNGSAVENASVNVTDGPSGETDANGTYEFTVPETEELTVTVEDENQTVVLERTFDLEPALEASFVGNATQGEPLTVEVTRNGSAVENASVNVTDGPSGATDANGSYEFTVPEDASALEVVVSEDDDTVTLTTDVEPGLNATLGENLTVGENATVTVTRDGEAVENATVTVNGSDYETDAQGQATFVVPDVATLNVTVSHEGETVGLSREL